MEGLYSRVFGSDVRLDHNTRKPQPPSHLSPLTSHPHPDLDLILSLILTLTLTLTLTLGEIADTTAALAKLEETTNSKISEATAAITGPSDQTQQVTTTPPTTSASSTMCRVPCAVCRVPCAGLDWIVLDCTFNPNPSPMYP